MKSIAEKNLISFSTWHPSSIALVNLIARKIDHFRDARTAKVNV